MRSLLVAGTLGGVTLLAVLVLSSSPRMIVSTLTTSAVPVVCASVYHFVPLSLYAFSWRALIPPDKRPRRLTLVRLRWIGESVNALLPVAQVGGDMARARLLSQTGVPGAAAAASMVADMGAGAASQVVFTIFGVIAVSWHGSVGQLSRAIALAAALSAAGAGALLAVARLGVGRIVAAIPLVRRVARASSSWPGHAADIDRALAGVLARRWELLRAFSWHMAGWLAQVGETWLILRLMGRGVSWPAALAMESLAATARSIAFLVPGGLGVQEGALVLVASHFGIRAPQALSLAIVKRMREVLVGAPAILAWSIAERHFIDRIWRGRKARRPPEGDA
jgi:putative membrane protein